MPGPFRRVIWIVLDSVGIGEMPDAAAYGDAGSDTLGNIAKRRALHPSSSPSNPASSTTGTPSEVALSSFDPASSPATT